MDPDFLRPEASRYVASQQPAPSAVMTRLLQEVEKEGQPAVNPGSGALLRVLTAASGGRRVLEVGTNLGLGALWMLGGMPKDGHLDTIELDPEMVRCARENLAESGDAHRATVHEGAALEVLSRLTPGYDLIFLDCVKEEYPEYLEHAVRLARVGGIIVADNLLWHGAMWDPENREASTEALRRYMDTARTHPRLVTTLVPTGDGLALSVVR